MYAFSSSRPEWTLGSILGDMSGMVANTPTIPCLVGGWCALLNSKEKEQFEALEHFLAASALSRCRTIADAFCQYSADCNVT